MTIEEAKDLFLNVIESIPGIHAVKSEKNPEGNEKQLFNVEQLNNKWNFSAHLIILKTANARAIVESLSALLKHILRNQKESFGKLNVFIGGLTND